MVFAKSKKFIVFLLGTNFLVVLLYLLVCLVPYLNPGDFWFIAILGLGFPLLFILVVLLGFIWLLLKSKWVFLSFCAILLSWQQLSVALAVNFKSSENGIYNNKADSSLRVLSWNVSKWDEGNKSIRGGESFRNLMFDYIELQNADILCFQEFFESYDQKKFESNIPKLKSLGFQYYFFYPTSFINNRNYQFGLSIFSKHPIVGVDSINNKSGIHSEGLCYADIQFLGDIIRVFNVHPESPGFKKHDFSDNGSIKVNNSVFSKIKNSYSLRSEQTINAKKFIEKSPYPAIVCADLGDIPNSFSYFFLKGDLQDVFLKKGKGLGRTYRFISPSLRIDYIFVDKKLNIGNYYKSLITYSDHYPIIADITLNK